MPATVREIRKRYLKKTQEELAAELGYSRAETISDWERGATEPPREKLEELASLAGFTYVEAFGEEPKPAQVPGDESDELVRQIDEINRRPTDDWLKPWWIAEISAAYRAAAMREAEIAARIRAEAMREAEIAGRSRASVMGMEADLTRSRLEQVDRRAIPHGAPLERPPETPGQQRRVG